MANELYHHGILGQRWGIRRYQNPDGSLTSAGKKRYGTMRKAAGVAAITTSIAGVASAAKAVTGANADAFKPGKDGKPSQAEKTAKSGENIVNESKKIIDTVHRATVSKEDLSGYSDDELRKIISRKRLESEYDSLSLSEMSSGEETVKNILDVIGTAAAIGVSAATIYSLVKSTKSDSPAKEVTKTVETVASGLAKAASEPAKTVVSSVKPEKIKTVKEVVDEVSDLGVDDFLKYIEPYTRNSLYTTI